MTDILFVEDETDLAQIVSDCLQFKGYGVTHYTNGADAFLYFKKSRPDIVVLDVMVPELDGFDLARKIREIDEQIPIIFVTARVQTADVLKGFDIGGSDYMKKPYSIEELIVRMEVQLKRLEKNSSNVYAIGAYQFDAVYSKLTINGKEKKISYRESELLRMLVDHQTQIVKRADILSELWEYESFFTGRSLDVFISRLRSYLKSDPNIEIVNIRGVGYMLVIH
ncbi:response regulator transcription factor [Pedobacter cryoconitis]|uniref:DNA-binding response OmpR family regulator n=1 Tax=Pedobacter cryoconitis TaxID=188932 RepID=A0A327T6A7_9SPHI|nr:response regulator transcription factor [Pedobacter cryoconitis]RAJ35614.1 DNA-binding response OmpR family regulator [Pedobacter cryoconitis]